jgi:hypothetical protein
MIDSPLFVDAEDIGGYDVTVRVAPERGRLVATEVVVSQRPGGPAVTVEGLRGLGLAPLLRAAAERLESDTDAESGQYRGPSDLAEDNIARLVAQGPTPETLDVVAFVYRRCVALGESPAKTVRETFGLTSSKAGRWIALARERGLLGKAEGPGKASV